MSVLDSLGAGGSESGQSAPGYVPEYMAARQMANHLSARGFKGIALFTPGGDVVYAIEPQKRDRWHIHLCVAVQEMLGLPEPPHFLVPCYSATVDRFFNPSTQQFNTIAEVMPAAWRYRALLDTVFHLDGASWQGKPVSPELCNPLAMATYREQFPQLWEAHDMVMRLGSENSRSRATGRSSASAKAESDAEVEGYVFRLFVRGDGTLSTETLIRLREMLDRALGHPYTLKVVDVLKHPNQAELDRVSAVPTLIRIFPHPIRRIVGEIDDLDRLLGLLGS